MSLIGSQQVKPLNWTTRIQTDLVHKVIGFSSFVHRLYFGIGEAEEKEIPKTW